MDAKSVVFPQILNLIRAAERILLVSDGKPDGDSVGSATAIFNWLKHEGKNVQIFCAAPIPSTLLYLDGVSDITTDPAIFKQPSDLVITFDASDLRRCGIEHLLPQIPSPYKLVVFDHHATNARYGQVNAIWTEACSTAELVYEFFEHNRLPIDAKIATSLLTGILTDTSCFSNAATTSSGLEAAGRLCSLGARASEILRRTFKNKSVAALRLWGVGLARLQHNASLDLAWTYFLLDDLRGLTRGEEAMDDISNFLNAVCGGSDALLVLRELPDGYLKGSFRSAARDISKVAKLLGGGGHKKAAGFTIRGRLEEKDGHVRIALA